MTLPRPKTRPLLVVLLSVFLLPVLAPGVAHGEPDHERKIIIGAVGQTREEIEQRERETGYRLRGVRVFRRWDEPLLVKDQYWARDTGHTIFLSVKSRRKDGALIPWREIARAGEGTDHHREMLRHAREIKKFGARVYLVFNHEPDAAVSRRMGSPRQFVTAWRRVVRTYRKAGVRNARFVWTMTDWAFSQHGGRAARKYYPGDAFVDDIAADVYNWHSCRNENGPWRELAELIEPHRRFGAKHPQKGLMLLEWGTAEDRSLPGRKAKWLRDAARLFARPEYRQYTALLHWDDRNTGIMDGTDCDFDYRSSPSAHKAWQSMMAAPVFAASPLPVPPPRKRPAVGGFPYRIMLAAGLVVAVAAGLGLVFRCGTRMVATRRVL